MAINRRALLGAGLAATAGAFGLAGCRRGDTGSDGGGAGGGSATSGGGDASLALTWWGNDLRNKLTVQAIDAYEASHEGVTIEPQPGEWASYWDRLATQVAGGGAPDIIQMDEAYISEYATRGALLDLTDAVDTSKFLGGMGEGGVVGDITAGISIAVSTVCFIVNPAVFEAAGVEVPDDTTWTWEQFGEIAAEVTAKSPAGTVGASTAFSNNKLLRAWLRQKGTDLFLADGEPGYTPELVDEYLQLVVGLQQQGALGEPAAIVEDSTAALDQSLFGTGKSGIALIAANQLAALTSATGQELQLTRWPSMTGKAADRQAWYSSSSLFAVSAKSENPEAAIEFIDWWVNDPACAEIVLNERGTPPNTDSAAAIEPSLDETGLAVAEFLAGVEADLGATPALPPPGAGSADAALGRAISDVLFEQASTAQAAQTFVDDLASSLG